MAIIGYATLQIIPSLDGVTKSMERQLGGLKGFGKSVGRSLGDDIAAGVDGAAKRVEQAASKIQSARDKEAAAADKVAAAEERIEEVREKGGSALKRAETQRLAAQRSQSAALRDIERATKELTDAQQALARAQEDVARGPKVVSTAWLDNLKAQASGSGDDAGDGFVGGFSSAVASIGTKAGPIALAITAAAGVALAGGKLIGDQVVAGMGQLQDQANIQAKLGIDGPSMARVAMAAAKAYASNFGESVAANMDTARAAIQSGLLDVNASTGDQSKMIGQLDTVASVLGEEIPAVARAAQQAIRTGLAPDATAAFDLITKGQQAGLNVSEDWLDTLNEYGTQFRKLGLDGPAAVGLLSQAVKGGARDTDVAADALKEFSIRAVDGSKLTNESFTALGLNADEMARKFAAGGPAAAGAFDQVTDALRGVQDPIQQSQIAVGLFGTQAEDLGAALNSMDLSSAVQQIGAVEGATQRAADTAGGTAASAWESMKRSVEVAIDGIQQKLAGGFGPYISNLANLITAHQPQIIGFFTGIADAALAGTEVTIRSIGLLAEGFGQLLAPIGDVLGAMNKFQAWQADIRGDHAQADALRAEAEGFFSWGEGLTAFGREAKNFRADGIRETLRATAEQAAAAAAVTRDLGDQLTLLPDQKTVVLTAPTADVLAGIDTTKYAIEQIPGTKDFRVIPKTEEATAQVNSWISQQTGKSVEPVIRPKMVFEGIDASIGNYFANLKPTITPNVNFSGGGGSFGPPPPPRIPGRAAGGVVDSSGRIRGPGSGLSDSILAAVTGGPGGFIRVSNAESINTAASTAKNWSLIAAMNAGADLGGWFKSLPAFATGGAVGPDVDAAKALAGTPYSQGNRTDCSGMVARVINDALGMDGGLMSTKNAREWLSARGFVEGSGGPGQISVGWYDRGPNPNDGHMAMTLSDGTNAEAGGSNSTFTLGADASGANDPQFDHHMYLPKVYGGEGPAGSASPSSPFAGGSAIAAAVGGGAAPSTGASGGGGGSSSSSSAGSAGSSFKLPTSFSGLARMGLDGMGITTKGAPESPERTFEFGNALGEAVGGQVESLGGLFGVNGSPSWLKAASQFIGGIGISDKSGNALFGGGAAWDPLGANASAAPLSATPDLTGTMPPADVHGARAGQEPGPVFNTTIQARDAEGALEEWNRWQNLRVAAKTSRF